MVFLRGVLGGAIGGTVGFLIFRWLAQQGWYGMMIPGALIGLGAGLAARGRSLPLGVLCAAAAIGVAMVAEWLLFPFLKDKSFAFFLTHLHQLRATTLIMIALGAAFAFWFGQGH